MSHNNELYIFLPVENYRRELDYKINMARYFCNRGFRAIIGDSVRLRIFLSITKYRGIFIEKGSIVDPNYYLNLQSKDILTYDLCEEGAVPRSYWLDQEEVAQALKPMRKVFLWSKFQENDLLSLTNDNAITNKFIVTGHPSFELSQKKYREMFRELNPISIDKQYILVNTNFACSSTNYEKEQQRCKRPVEDAKRLKEYFDYSIEKHKEFKSNLHKIIQNLENEFFLIRPHPVEHEAAYSSEFGHYKNVIVSKEGTINPILSMAKLLLHNDCTTALQAYLMGVPVISLNHGDKDEKVIPWPLSFGATPHTLHETISLINFTLQNRALPDTIEKEVSQSASKAIEKYFHQIPGVTKSIFNYIIYDFETNRELLSAKTYPKTSSFSSMKKIILSYLPIFYKRNIHERQDLLKFYGKLEDIDKRIGLFEKYDPLGIKIVTKKFRPGLFLMETSNP